MRVIQREMLEYDFLRVPALLRIVQNSAEILDLQLRHESARSRKEPEGKRMTNKQMNNHIQD